MSARNDAGRDTVVVRVLARALWSRGRYLTRHGQHGCLLELPVADALRLVDTGQARLSGWNPRI